MRKTILFFGVPAALLALSGMACADDDIDRARSAFLQGTALVEKAQWAEALTAFERARSARKHPVTTFNMAACERAMGHYTRARMLYQESLAEHESTVDDRRLPASLKTEAQAIIGEIDRMLVRLTLTLEPRGAALAVDGRPLLASGNEFVAGVRAPGPGDKTPDVPFTVVFDPGLHVLIFSQRGFRDTMMSRVFNPGHRSATTLELSRLPATLKVSASESNALVAINGIDVGPAPVDILRPPGNYRILVRREGFATYESQLTVDAGEEASLRATLRRESPSIFSRWWFWSAAGVLMASAAATTYLLTRPAPTRPDVGGGTLGWRVDVR